jgi:uncharacterized protein (TIGR02996 family)
MMSVPGLTLVAAPESVATTLPLGTTVLFSNPGAVLVGRSQRAGLRLQSPKVAPLHVQISFHFEHWRIKPLRPAKVWLNGMPLPAGAGPLQGGTRITLPDGIELTLNAHPVVRNAQLEKALRLVPTQLHRWLVYADYLEENGDPLGQWIVRHANHTIPESHIRFHGVATESMVGCVRRLVVNTDDASWTLWLEQALQSPYSRFLSEVDAYVVDDAETDAENELQLALVFSLLLSKQNLPPIQHLRLGFSFRPLGNEALLEQYALLKKHCPTLQTPFEHLVETRQTLHLLADDGQVRSDLHGLSEKVFILHRRSRFVLQSMGGTTVNEHPRTHWTLCHGDVIAFDAHRFRVQLV